MTISGTTTAKCRECFCVSIWHIDSMPFVDSEILGTCGDCIEKKDHTCKDETYDPFEFIENGRKKRMKEPPYCLIDNK